MSDDPAGKRLAAEILIARKRAQDQGSAGLTRAVLAEICQQFIDTEVERVVALRIKHAKPVQEEIPAIKDLGTRVCEEIYSHYPRKVAPREAQKQIAIAVKAHGRDRVLAATIAYVKAVCTWPAKYRYKENRDTVPYPASWYKDGRYLDDPKEWYPAGQYTREDDPGASAPDQTSRQEREILPEPDGWRQQFSDFIHVKEPWHRIEESSRRYICNEMERLNLERIALEERT